MFNRLTDEKIRAMFAPHLQPDEGDLIYVAGASKSRTPMWSRLAFGMLASVVNQARSKWYLIGVTNERLLLIQISMMNFGEEAFTAHDLSEVDRADIKGRLWDNQIEINLRDGTAFTFAVSKLPMVKGQSENLASLAQLFRARGFSPATS